MNKAALTEWATAVRPRSEVPGDRFAMAKEASAARELRLPSSSQATPSSRSVETAALPRRKQKSELGRSALSSVVHLSSLGGPH